jgi:hypothetical protein
MTAIKGQSGLDMLSVSFADPDPDWHMGDQQVECPQS